MFRQPGGGPPWRAGEARRVPERASEVRVLEGDWRLLLELPGLFGGMQLLLSLVHLLCLLA